MRFSEKEGHKVLIPLNDNLDTNLEFNLDIWNMSYGLVFSLYRDPLLSDFPTTITGLKSFFISFYIEALIEPIDQIPTDINKAIKKLKKYMLQAKTNEIYDLLEILSDTFPDIRNSYQSFEDEINKVLEKHASIYRLINKSITPITSEHEIQSIEEALQNSNPYSGVQQHLKQALSLMSDRQNPDYRNSIKESICAVESICKIIISDKKATLGQALKIIENKFGLHPALKSSLSQLYGYSSDGDGIRHAMLEESNLNYIDAKFMLVACTNFINYLIEKTKDQN
ncbi:hypothetical protein B9T33_01515 [Acinetobacter sp. ANC 5054]|uniref:AbiJ-NTD4 domain-containing protein n=1 Tax=Acinetobacter sp. ANC 5054 TaxID=1977877 RepID=UPI000A331E4A|nr:hypothetical protein [Acinetobacter sp. ANC 5054]OTG84489.1 hypothetical protein B9T33_01515 [Acinetobacter sp. ANC 5054]